MEPHLAEALARFVDDARAAWPEIGDASEAVARRAARAIADERDPMRALAELHAGDLYLASACVAGDPAALAAFDRRYLSEVAAYIARTDSDPHLADEVRQLLRHRLLVGPPPKIASYSGQGPLGAWLRTVAVRTALELVRSRTPVAAAEPERALHDPELDYLKTRYAREVGDAFASVLATLPEKQRNILRLYFLEGMTIDAVARLYRVHRMTVSRWLQQWRQDIFAATEALLRERLRVSPQELQSLLRLVQSRVDISIRRFLS